MHTIRVLAAGTLVAAALALAGGAAASAGPRTLPPADGAQPGQAYAQAADRAAAPMIQSPTPTPTVCVPAIARWQAIASLNTARAALGLAYGGNGLYYAVGGVSATGRNIPIESYDLATDTWTNRASLLVGVSDTGAAGIGGYIYVPGGYDGTSARTENQRYDTSTNTVTLLAPMPAAVYADAVTAWGMRVYVLGGSATGTAGTTNYIYDAVTNSWSTGAPLPASTFYAAATSSSTRVFVLGGGTVGQSYLVKIYDPASDAWVGSTTMTWGRGGPGAFFDGWRLWAVGGGWTTYQTNTEYWRDLIWFPAGQTTYGARTVGAAYAGHVGIMAGGWSGSYEARANKIDMLACATATPTPTASRTATRTPTPQPTATATDTPGATATGTPGATATDTPGPTATATGTLTPPVFAVYLPAVLQNAGSP